METTAHASGIVPMGGMHGATITSIFSMRVVVLWRWTKAGVARDEGDAGQRRASPEAHGDIVGLIRSWPQNERYVTNDLLTIAMISWRQVT